MFLLKTINQKIVVALLTLLCSSAFGQTPEYHLESLYSNQFPNPEYIIWHKIFLELSTNDLNLLFSYGIDTTNKLLHVYNNLSLDADSLKLRELYNVICNVLKIIPKHYLGIKLNDKFNNQSVLNAWKIGFYTALERHFNPDIDVIGHIEDLEFRARVYNVLKRNDITFISSLTNMTEEEVLELPLLDIKGLEEIKAALEIRGLHLRQPINISEYNSLLDLIGTPNIHTLKISNYFLKRLKRMNFYYVSDLTSITESKFISVCNDYCIYLSTEYLGDINKALQKKGLSFKKEGSK